MTTTGETTTEGTTDDEVRDAPDAAAPPRRRRASRRAASRPAGPPVHEEPAVHEEPPAVLEAASEPAPEPAPAPRRARAAATAVFQAPDLTPAPRRHRAASRPAGPPQPHLDDPETSAEAPATSEPVEPPAVTQPAAPPVTVPDPADDEALEVPEVDAEVDAEAIDAADDADNADNADDADEESDGADDAPEGADDDARGRRPRRRRGGRGRRRRSDASTDADDAAEDPTEDGEVAQGRADEPGEDLPVVTDGTGGAGTDGTDGTDGDVGAEDGADDSAAGSEDEGSDDSTSRRRRRRRRGRTGEAADTPDDAGAPGGPADDADSDVAPAATSRSRSRARRTAEVSDDVTAVRGSTRLEAKRQRRRDGRDGGRRRQAITEAEFLARRESVERTMVVRSSAGRAQVAVLEDGVLVEHYVARKQHTSMIGNVHLGRVQNVLPSMEAAFVDIGRGRNAVLYAGEVDWDAAGLTGAAKKIESALKPGDPVLVQVTKDPIGHKGSRLTSQISLPGRYLVYVPNGSMTGISRKLPDTERSRLKAILKAVVPADAGVIVRTAAEGASETELRRDVERLAAQWEEISKRAKQVSPPTLLHGEPDLVVKVVRDVFNEDFARLVVVGDEAWTTVAEYVESVAPDLSDRVSRWDGDEDAFTHFRVDEQIAKALERKVWLPSGGSLVIDRTEAMTVVDVNTGRFTGAGGNLEETVTKNNLEAAEEIVRQLRLRDIGGIIVVDFIDMVLESNRELVLRRLVECLGRDRTKHQVAEVTSLGLVQMTRKRVGQGLIEAFSDPCEHCAGRGVVVHPELLESAPPAPLQHAHAPSHASRPADAAPEAAAALAPAEAHRTREDAARDAVRDAMRGVAEAARAHHAGDAGEGGPAQAPAPFAADVIEAVERDARVVVSAAREGSTSEVDERAEAARAVAALVGDAIAAAEHAAEAERTRAQGNA